jgi:glucosamine--fructose-6-phosphate aminotransferase (isomerizing)
VSSEISGFSNYLKNYFVVPDSAMITVRLATLENNQTKIVIERDNQDIEVDTEIKTLGDTVIHPVTPDPYPHWTLKEIHDQVHSVRQSLNFGGRLQSDTEVHLGGLSEHQGELLKIQHLTILASGTSFHAGLLGKKYFQQLMAFQTVQVIDAGEFSPQDIQTPPESSGILLISQSGETRDIIRCLEDIRLHQHLEDLPIFATVNVVGSFIARESGCGVYLNCGREVGVAATKSFLSQCIVLILIGLWFSQKRSQSANRNLNRNRKIIRELHTVHTLVEETLNQQVIQKIEESADHILASVRASEGSLFILGHNEGLPIAREGALKIKEISYIHAEAYSSAGLKHGPLALIEKGTPIIVLRLPNQTTRVDTAAEETKARGAYLISISHERCGKPGLYDQEILIPNSATLSPVLATIPLQYLAYLLSSKQGLSVDFPKNLAKCVTTD